MAFIYYECLFIIYMLKYAQNVVVTIKFIGSICSFSASLHTRHRFFMILPSPPPPITQYDCTSTSGGVQSCHNLLNKKTNITTCRESLCPTGRSLTNYMHRKYISYKYVSYIKLKCFIYTKLFIRSINIIIKLFNYNIIIII